MRSQRPYSQAGPATGLPLFLLLGWLAGLCFSLGAEPTVRWTFQEFTSSCIDLGHYDAKTMQLTVRFVSRHTGRFYRYSNVSAEVWTKLNALNETGGMGGYFNETVVQYPNKYPFKELIIPSFDKIPTKKKAGNPK